MKPKDFQVLDLALEQGISFGLNNAFKHTETQSMEVMQDCLHRELMNAICEWFEFDEPSNT